MINRYGMKEMRMVRVEGGRRTPLATMEPVEAVQRISEALGFDLLRCAQIAEVKRSNAVRCLIDGVYTTVEAVKVERAGRLCPKSNDTTDIAGLPLQGILNLDRLDNNTKKKLYVGTRDIVLTGSVECFSCSDHVGCSHCHGEGVCPTCHGAKQATCPDCNGRKVCRKCHGAKTLHCSFCSGTGHCPDCCGTGYETCGTCGGTGHYVVYGESSDGDYDSPGDYIEYICETCNGSGEVVCETCCGDRLCPYCLGEGRYECPDCDGRGVCATCSGQGKINCTDCKGAGDCRKCRGSKCERCRGTGAYQTFTTVRRDAGRGFQKDTILLPEGLVPEGYSEPNLFKAGGMKWKGKKIYDGCIRSYAKLKEVASDGAALRSAVGDEGLYKRIMQTIDSLVYVPQTPEQKAAREKQYLDFNLRADALPVTKITMVTPSREFSFLLVGNSIGVYYDRLPSLLDRLKAFFRRR